MRLFKRIADEIHLMRTDFWASDFSGPALILAFGILWLSIMLIVL